MGNFHCLEKNKWDCAENLVGLKEASSVDESIVSRNRKKEQFEHYSSHHNFIQEQVLSYKDKSIIQAILMNKISNENLEDLQECKEKKCTDIQLENFEKKELRITENIENKA